MFSGLLFTSGLFVIQLVVRERKKPFFLLALFASCHSREICVDLRNLLEASESFLEIYEQFNVTQWDSESCSPLVYFPSIFFSRLSNR